MANNFTNNESSTIIIDELVDHRILFGQQSVNINVIENRFLVRIVARNDEIRIFGEKKHREKAVELFDLLIEQVKRSGSLSEQSLNYAIEIVSNEEYAAAEHIDDRIVMTKHNQPVRPKSDGQQRYVRSMINNDLVFSIGPAGTGKTFLAVAVAVRMLEEKKVDRIVLVRPAVEAEEQLGFLPGDLKAKVDPYLRPLYDSLYDLLPQGKLDKYFEKGTIEVAPLAFMRGRTLNNSFIILDEGQNTTIGQMKMFLTRMGMNSKVVVTGDITQIDLKPVNKSGLIMIQDILKDIRGIDFVYLGKADVVRHSLVQQIIHAYEIYYKE